MIQKVRFKDRIDDESICIWCGHRVYFDGTMWIHDCTGLVHCYAAFHILNNVYNKVAEPSRIK